MNKQYRMNNGAQFGKKGAPNPGTSLERHERREVLLRVARELWAKAHRCDGIIPQTFKFQLDDDMVHIQLSASFRRVVQGFFENTVRWQEIEGLKESQVIERFTNSFYREALLRYDPNGIFRREPKPDLANASVPTDPSGNAHG